METGRVPIPIVWPHGGSEVYVTGDFNSYSLMMLTGDSEKFCVIWCDPGVHLYRFLVDGSYVCDHTKPTTLSEDTLYNTTEVADLPQPISNLHLLSLEELEKLDSQLFVNPQDDIDRKVGKVKSFLLRVVAQRKFRNAKKAVNKIKAWVKGRKVRKHFLEFSRFQKWERAEKKEQGTMTEPMVNEEMEEMKKIIMELKLQNEGLGKKIDGMKNAQEKKKPPIRKVDPPLISIKDFLTPSKPFSIRDLKSELTPKSRTTFNKFSKK